MHANSEHDGQCIASICICHLFKKRIINPSGFVQERKEIQTTRCISRTSQKRRAHQEARGRNKIPKGFAMSGLEALVSFSFCRLDNNAWELNWSAHPPVPFFSRIHHLKEINFLPPWFWLSPRGCFIQRAPHVTFFFFCLPAISKSKLIFLHRCCVILGTSDRCCWVEVNLIGIFLQESEIIWETVRQLLISLWKWGLWAVVESHSLRPSLMVVINTLHSHHRCST